MFLQVLQASQKWQVFAIAGGSKNPYQTSQRLNGMLKYDVT